MSFWCVSASRRGPGRMGSTDREEPAGHSRLERRRLGWRVMRRRRRGLLGIPVLPALPGLRGPRPRFATTDPLFDARPAKNTTAALFSLLILLGTPRWQASRIESTHKFSKIVSSSCLKISFFFF